MNWDQKFMSVAKTVAQWSKDPLYKVGAVIVDWESHTILSVGYNGFCRGDDDSPEHYADRDYKRLYVVHAELNACLNAARQGTAISGSHLYVYGLPPCLECAKVIIQAGIQVVCASKSLSDVPERWADSCQRAVKLLGNVGIIYDHIELQEEPCQQEPYGKNGA